MTDSIREQVRELGFAYLPPVSLALISGAQQRIQGVPPGNYDHFPGLNHLFGQSGLHDLAESLVQNISPLQHTVQLTRRAMSDGGGAHLDGYEPPDHNSEIDTPDAVLGIYLSDVPAPKYGAFTVWPDGRVAIRTWALGLKQLPMKSENQQPSAGEPLHVFGAAGTAFMIHGAVQHCNAMREIEEGTRDAVFVRVYRNQHPRDIMSILRSGGRDWDY